MTSPRAQMNIASSPSFDNRIIINVFSVNLEFSMIETLLTY